MSTLLPLSFQYGPDKFRVAQADLSKEQEVIKLFDNVADTSTFGPVQILVVNHGIAVSEDVSIIEMSLSQWDNTLSVNLTAAFLVVREFLRRLSLPSVSDEVKQKVNVVFVGSTAGKFGEAGNLDYAVTKSGRWEARVHNVCVLTQLNHSAALMHGFLLSLKNEIVQISPMARVNCVAPGWVRTAMAEHALKDGKIIKRALATYVSCSYIPAYLQTILPERR